MALDLQACGHCLESWTNRLDTAHPRSNDESSIVLPPRLTWLITALKVPEKSLLEEGFHRVRDELDDIRLQWQRALRDGIPANWREGRPDYRPDSSLQSIPASADQQKRPWGPLFAMVALTALLIMAIWILPAYFAVEEPDSSVSTTTSKDAAQEEAPAEPEPPTAEELAALLVKREEAQAVLDEVINLKLQLESQEVNRWAEKAFAEAIELRDAGDEPYRIQEFDAALDIYAQAKLALQALVVLMV